MVEVARQCFVSLNNENNMYYVLNDGNFVFKFYEKSKENANDIFKAWLKGGYRERYAVENGNPHFSNDNQYIEFLYSTEIDYQDANVALFDTVTETWVN